MLYRFDYFINTIKQLQYKLYTVYTKNMCKNIKNTSHYAVFCFTTKNCML